MKSPVFRIPKNAGAPSVLLKSPPRFSTKEKRAQKGFQHYSELDRLGRCGEAFALVGPETMPADKRGKIGHVMPTGYSSVEYESIEGRKLFHRCHLMAYQLTGQNDNVQNLIAGTRDFNVLGMKPFEDRIACYVRETENHVLYRVLPIFRRRELVARGVRLEALSLEDQGRGLAFNAWCHNAQRGIVIDYKDGSSRCSA